MSLMELLAVARRPALAGIAPVTRQRSSLITAAYIGSSHGSDVWG